MGPPQILEGLFGVDQIYEKTSSEVWCTFRQGVLLLGVGKVIGIGVEDKALMLAGNVRGCS